MMTAPASTLTVDLVARFPGIVTAETRPNFAGFIVEKESPEQLAEAIIQFYQGNYEDKFRAEIQKMTQNFSWDIELKNIESFL